MTTRVALVGCGRWGRNILRDLTLLGAEVQVVDPSVDARAAARRAGATSTAESLDGLTDCDGVVVAVPIEQTGSVVIEVLRRLDACVPVFVEKPMAHSAALARQIVALAADRVFVMDKWRYHPAVEAVRRMTETGMLGEIESIRFERWDVWGESRSLSPTWWLAPHDLSMVMHWLGRLPPVASARRTVHAVAEDLCVTLVADPDSSPVVTIDIRTASPVRRRSFLVTGTKQKVCMRDPEAGYLEVTDRYGPNAGLEQHVAIDGAQPLLAELKRFVGHVCGGPAPYGSAAEGLQVVEHLAEIDRLLRFAPEDET